MKIDYKRLAGYVENLFSPDKIIILGGSIVILYLINTNFVNNLLTFYVSLISIYLLRKLIGKHITNDFKAYLISALIGSIIFISMSSFIPISKELRIGAIAMLLNLIILLTIRDFWKISAHTSIYTNFCTVLTFISSAFIFTFAFLPLVMWSRISLNRHTYAQIFIGSIAGLILPLSTLHLLY